jgi:hypothetical protein
MKYTDPSHVSGSMGMRRCVWLCSTRMIGKEHHRHRSARACGTRFALNGSLGSRRANDFKTCFSDGMLSCLSTELTEPLFKTDRIRAEWNGAALDHVLVGPLLKRVVYDACDFLAKTHDLSATITSLLRTPAENDALYGGDGKHLVGVHVAGRGADLRWPETSEIAMQLSEHLNTKWVYDPERRYYQVCVLEGGAPGSGSSGRHVHVQVHPNTVEVSA